MTEDDWSLAGDPKPMLDHLKGLASDRKLRLFLCGFCRSVWDRVPSKRSRAAELYADGLVSERELGRAYSMACDVFAQARRRLFGRRGFAWADRKSEEYDRLELFAEAAYCHTPMLIGRLKRCTRHSELLVLAPNTLRDIFGNPFRPVMLSPSWLTNAALGLAEGIYADRAFDRLPILADALQDAGCEDAGILAHCRGDGPHVRGCWVVDGVLGKG
ncbi:hypothetical protein [Limnoglobus roseus]|uniref:SMI1/KNR4 family protein n=1 Tax=Limnoglobus roseus TaxID=2598579 RepID=A0A5C1AB77_9BACT|nr:hypothetical protein [Limnoglobus roseus]QEL15477.1 hypothetical protein PX52LOC_02400 [Limnoglobus roseus]